MPIDVDAIRRYNWTQGSLIDEGVAARARAGSEGCVAVLLSQDCDLLHQGDGEPNVEFCIGRLLTTEPNGNYTHGKNARLLHLPVRHRGKDTFLELKSADRWFCDRAFLCSEQPSSELLLDDDATQILIDWIVNRYARDPFPDAFNERIRDALLKKIPALMKKLGRDVVCVYAAMNSLQELPQEKKYTVELIAAMRAQKFDDPKALANAQKLVRELAALLQTSSAEGDVDVINATVLSEKGITLHDERYLRRLDFDYLSLRDQTNADIQPVRRR